MVAGCVRMNRQFCEWFGLCPNADGPKAEPGAQPETSINLNGGAEPRLTSGGAAGADGIKFHDQLLIFKTVSHIRRRSRSGWVKFHDGA